MKLFLLLVTAFGLVFSDMPRVSAAPLGARLPAAELGVGADVTPVQARRGGRGGRVYRSAGGRGARGARGYRAAPRYAGPRGPRVARQGQGVRRAQVARPRYVAPRGQARRAGARTVRRETVRRETVRRQTVRRDVVRRPGDRRAIESRRYSAGVGRSARVAGRVAYRENARHYRGGRWYAGSPRWRGDRRWHGGRYWRSAYDGWYYWNDSAWIWAPTFGVVYATTIPVWSATTETVVVVSYDPWTPGWYDWCARRYRSFDPATGFWISYSGVRRFCVYH